MPRVVRFPSDEVEGLDEEFLYHLNRGADHLARGESEPARSALARAAEMRPRDPKVLGLLGQALYRLGRYAEAADAYGRLVEESPLEAGAQVNLGLAFLKAGRAADAIIHLERALDLAPEHRRAMGYLGLAWLEGGNVARAREWFERAGREQMVARCDALLHGGADRAEKPAPPRAAEAHAEKPAAPRAAEARAEKAAAPRVAEARAEKRPEPHRSSPRPERRDPAAWTVVAPTQNERRDEEEAESDLQDALRLLEPATMPTQVAAPLPPAPSPISVAPFAVPPAAPKAVPDSGLAAGRLLPTPDSTFHVSDVVQVAVRGEVLVRLAGLAAVVGHVDVTPEAKRLRGRSVEESFGSGREAMQRARGDGSLVFAAKGRRFTVIDLRGGAAHFREEAVFGFEGSLSFENGRLAAPGAPEIELVRLAGEGTVLVTTAGDLISIDVTPDRPIRAAATALVGWEGALTPRLLPLARPHADPDAVELAGEGRVLLASGPAVA